MRRTSLRIARAGLREEDGWWIIFTVSEARDSVSLVPLRRRRYPLACAGLYVLRLGEVLRL